MPYTAVEPLEPRTLLAATPVPLRINAGGPALTDSLARTFEGDNGFVGGTPFITTFDVGNTTDDALFASYRTGREINFTRPVPNGHYNLLLEFADAASTAPGQRTFDVWAEGAYRLRNFDIYKEAAAAYAADLETAPGGTALVRSIDLDVTDGRLDLTFSGVVGNAIISAINLIPTDIPAAVIPYVPPHGHYTPGTPTGDALNDTVNVMAASTLRRLGLNLLNYAGASRGNFPPNLLALAVSDSRAVVEDYADPRTDTLRPRGELSRTEELGWINHLDDFVYLGAGKKTNLPPDAPLAYENPDRVVGGLNVLRADGSVRYFERADAAALLGFPDAPPTRPPSTAEPYDPSVRDPRVAASASKLRGIGGAMQLFSNEHQGRYPLTPGLLNTYPTYAGSPERITPQTFVNPRGTTPAPPTNLTADQASAWIDASTDYAYLGAGKSWTAFRNSSALVFENPAEMTLGINVLFNDGHTEFREMRWAFETIARAGATSRLPLPGDATRDGTVNFDDLLVLAKNYNKPNQPFTAGDFNYDNIINFDDLLVLAKNYNRTTTGTATTAPILAAVSPTPATTKPKKPEDLTTPSRPPAPIAKPKPAPARKHP